MKILHVYKDYSPLSGGGGVARHIYGILKNISSKFHISIYTSEPSISMLGEKVFFGSYYKLLKQIIRADVVHIHGSHSVLTLITFLTCILSSKPYVYTPHCYYESKNLIKSTFKHIWNLTVEKWLTRYTKCYILLLPFWIRYAKEKGFNIDKVQIVPNCIDHDSILIFPTRDERRNKILTVSRLDKVKRIDLIIDAIDALPSDTELHIVGKGNDEATLKSLVRHKNSRDRIFFHGFISDKELAALSAKCSIFISASEFEGLPTSVLEASARGLFQVLSDIPAHQAILAEGSGVLFSLGDTTSLTKNYAKLLSECEYPNYNPCWTFEKFTWDRHIGKIQTIYDEAIVK